MKKLCSGENNLPMSEEKKAKIKVVLLGDGGVGKTTLIHRILTGEFTRKYVPTMGVEVNPLTFNTTRGRVILNCWDCAGQEKFGSLWESYYVGADACIVMFDTTANITYRSVKGWVNSIRKQCKDIPIILCGNKVDSRERKVALSSIDAHRELNLTKYFDISAKSNYNFEKPFLEIMRAYFNDPNLSFVSG